MTQPRAESLKRLADWASQNPADVRRKLIETMRQQKPDITQEEIDVELGLVEAILGF